MSAASSVCSDDSFEIVNNELDVEEPEDEVFSVYKPKVTFHEVFDVYPTDADIVARITFDNDFVKSTSDTVIVLPIAWKSIDQAVCAANIVGDFVRFDVKELPKVGVEDKFYQLCYCTGEKIVIGVSIPFSFREVHEDELVEFQKEQNKEFWTFRSRFAVLTDIYWNSLQENKVKVTSVENSTSVDQLDNVIDNEEKQNYASTSKLGENHKILLFTIMKNEYEELKEKYDQQQKASTEKISKLKSLLKQAIQNFGAVDQYENERCCTDILRKIKQDFFSESEFKEFDELLGGGRTKPSRVVESQQNNNVVNSNAAFIATSGGDILLAPPKPVSVAFVKSEDMSGDTNSSNNVPDDWKAEKAGLMEKCALLELLEAELSKRNQEIEDLNESLINQRQSEVEKVITITDNMRERYIKDVNKLKEQNVLLEEQLKDKNNVIESLNKNILEMSKLLTANEEEITNLKARDHSLVGFLERRNLKRISELEDRLHDLYSKMWSERKETIQLREDLLTSQALFNSLRDEKDKPNSENLTTENSAQTNTESNAGASTTTESTEWTENSAKMDRAAAHAYFYRVLQHNASARNGHDVPEKPTFAYLEQQIQSLLDQPVPKHSTEQSEAASLKPLETPILPKRMSSDSLNATEKEEALATKLVEVSVELEKMKLLYAKTKTDLEARLRDGAKQYAKLYMKYERHVKRLGSSTPKSSA